MTIDLSGQVALVTGAGSGIGRACALSLASCGADVWVNDLSVDRAIAVAKEVDGHALPGDVGNPQDWITPMVSQKALHIVIHNAGYDLCARLAESDRMSVERLHQVMLTGPLEITRMLLNPLKAASGSCVLFIASIHSRVTTNDMAAYAAAKAGQIAIVNSRAQDLGPDGIRAVAVSPGYIDSPLMEEWLSAAEDPVALRASVNAMHPSGRIGTPTEVANLVTFLVSSKAAFITGTNVVIDGGISTKLH